MIQHQSLNEEKVNICNYDLYVVNGVKGSVSLFALMTAVVDPQNNSESGGHEEWEACGNKRQRLVQELGDCCNSCKRAAPASRDKR